MAFVCRRTTLAILGAAAVLLAAFTSHSPAAEFPKPAREFIQSHCAECHDADAKKGGLDLNSLSTQLDDPVTEAKWIWLYDRVRRHEMPPENKQQPTPEQRATFMHSLGDYLAGHDAERRAKTGRVPFRRLNRVEYENTLHDLLKVDVPLVPLLPEDGSAYGFDNVSEALRLSSSQIEAYLAAADTAMDAATNFGARPEENYRHLSYLDKKEIRDLLAKPTGSINKDGSRFGSFLREVPDGVVIFVDQTFGPTQLRAARADVAGTYRFKLKGYAYQSTGRPQVVAKVMVTNFARTRMPVAFDLPAEPRECEFTLRMDEGEFIYLDASGCDFSPDGKHAQDVGGETFTGSGMAINWLEMEGPLLESWPPPTMHRMFGDLVQKQEKPRRREESYHIVSSNPDEDAAVLIRQFAQRAFRRPVEEKEVMQYIALAHHALETGGTLETALRRAYKAILVSPEFLFLQESPGKLDDYALASRLSYFLWSTTPDDELLDLAAQGKLHDPKVLHDQTERLLASPKAHAFTQNFCGQWLNLRAINATTPDMQLYPEFDELLKQSMVEETQAFFDEMLKSDLGVKNFVDSDFVMINRRLADLYDITGVEGEQIRKVNVSPDCHRGGLLTQAAILKVTANGTLTSPVVRGNWVMKRILGRVTPPPPADAGSIEPDTRGATTIREQLAKHRRSASCNSCHKYMDPPGFALENFDVIGGWRDHYRAITDKGPPGIDPILDRERWQYRVTADVDATGQLVDGRKFHDIDQFKKLLLDQQDEIARNLVNNLVAYATGAGVTFSDHAEVENILAHAKNNGYGLRTLVHEVVQSRLFQTK